MIARLVCWWKGHARMKRVEHIGHHFAPGDVAVDTVRFTCPRCGHIETRKVYARKRAA